MPAPSWLAKADRYLASAQILLSPEHQDVDSVVSRSYYAVRYIGLHFLEREGLLVDRKWQHETVLAQTITRSRNKHWMRDLKMAGRSDLADSLYELLKLRGKADYDRGKITEREARRVLEFAQNLLTAVKGNNP